MGRGCQNRCTLPMFLNRVGPYHARRPHRPVGHGIAMSSTVFLMVLGAALVHASWNALVKADGDRLALIKVMFSTQFACSMCLIPFVALPARESWPYLCTSAM